MPSSARWSENHVKVFTENAPHLGEEARAYHARVLPLLQSHGQMPSFGGSWRGSQSHFAMHREGYLQGIGHNALKADPMWPQTAPHWHDTRRKWLSTNAASAELQFEVSLQPAGKEEQRRIQEEVAKRGDEHQFQPPIHVDSHWYGMALVGTGKYWVHGKWV